MSFMVGGSLGFLLAPIFFSLKESSPEEARFTEPPAIISLEARRRSKGVDDAA